MQQNAIYTRDLAGGLRRDPVEGRGRGARAAAALRPTADACLELGVVDAVVTEPSGGAHRDHAKAAELLGDAIEGELDSMGALPALERRRLRRQKFHRMGAFAE